MSNNTSGVPVCVFAFILLLTIPAWGSAGPAQPASKAAVETSVSPEGCPIEKFLVRSPSMKRDIRVVVVLPPGYNASTKGSFPVLYALPGMGAPYATWAEMSPLRAALKEMPMIVVTFDGDRAGWYIDATQKGDSKFTTFFFDELIPDIESRYRTSGVRGVTGFSMGGFGALHYMLSRPGMFASASGLSSAIDRMGGRRRKPGRTVTALLGDYEKNRSEYEKNSIYTRVKKYAGKGVKLPPIMLHCGAGDGLLAENREFVQFLIGLNAEARKRHWPKLAGLKGRARRVKLEKLMSAERIDFDYRISPGGHNWTFWKGASEGVVRFHWKSFKRAGVKRKAGR